jgi:DNA polymerase-3 subunit alpha
METIPQYIERKHNPAAGPLPDPRMSEYLELFLRGLGVPGRRVIMAHHLGGYSWLEADKLRKAMGKKIPEEMEAEKEKFIAGFVEYGKWHSQKPSGCGS